MGKTIEQLLGKQETEKLLQAAKAGKTIIVGGTQGPSGKTTLARLLNDIGYNAVEEFQTHKITLDYKEES